MDDEPDIVALVAYHLAKAGYRVSTAATGPDALDAARQERPALVVLDLMLPGMSGYDVLEQLRARRARRATSPCSCSPRAAKSRTASAASRSAPTTTSRSRSARRSSCCASARSCGASAPAPQRRPTCCASARCRSTARRIGARRRTARRAHAHRVQAAAHARRAARPRAGARHLLETVWEAAPDIQTRTVDMHVQRLRTKLGAAGDLIETVRGFGYRLQTPQPPGAERRAQPTA